jgi:hypothetical protein
MTGSDATFGALDRDRGGRFQWSTTSREVIVRTPLGPVIGATHTP